jgi:hypothetical protein
MAKKWIQKAIKKPGSFTKQAKKAGESVQDFANQVLKKGSKASSKTKARARLAKTLKKMKK